MSTYFPIFRGKQFELIAVREFAQSSPGNELIHPIIEPVRDPTENTGLARMIAELEEHGFKYTIIVNPGKGDLSDMPDAAGTIVTQLEECEATIDNMSFGILFHAGGADHALEVIAASSLSDAKLNVIYDRPSAGPDDVGLLRDHAVEHHVLEQKNEVRSLGVFENPSCVQLLRTFKRRDKNIEYVDLPPSVFCSAHLFLEDDGFVGLSDYLTIGDDYSESGALPLALVIHLTYQNPDDRLIYVRHFHSRTNKDQSDPAGKFSEAVAELVAWVDENGITNPAIEAFKVYHHEGRYPGLGMIKKLSMQNHLYVMDEALSDL